jgi:hypothetical protein
MEKVANMWAPSVTFKIYAQSTLAIAQFGHPVGY